MTITREKLHRAVWMTPAWRLAKTYGISDNGLRKKCEKANIPMPGNAYWRRKNLGQAVEPLPRPPVGGVDPVTINPSPARSLMLPATWQPSGVIQNAVVPELDSDYADAVRDELVQYFKKNLAKGELDSRGRLTGSRGNNYCGYAVLPHNLDRAMLIWQKLLLRLEAHRCTVMASHPRERYQWVNVRLDDHTVQVELRDKVKASRSKNKIYLPWMYEKLQSKRSLTFKICSHYPDRMQKQWVDKEHSPLENWSNEIVRTVLTALEAERVLAPIRGEEKKRQEEQARAREKREKEERHLREVGEARIESLEAGARQWAESQRCAAFVSACEAELIRTGTLETNRRMARWLTWARNYASSLDPLQGDFLAEQDKTF